MAEAVAGQDPIPSGVWLLHRGASAVIHFISSTADMIYCASQRHHLGNRRSFAFPNTYYTLIDKPPLEAYAICTVPYVSEIHCTS